MSVGASCKLQSMNILKLCCFVTLFIIWIPVPADCNMLDMFRERCPYSQFCTVGSKISFPAEEKQIGNRHYLDPVLTNKTCCLDCHCDAACHIHGDCCPDVQIQAPTVLPQVCGQAILNTPFFVHFMSAGSELSKRDINLYVPRYRIVRECPTAYRDDTGTVEKCTADGQDIRDIDDHVLVSDSNGVNFKNKYCAFCHGITQFIRWNIAAGYCESFGGIINNSSSRIMRSYIVDNCMIMFILPTSMVDDIRIRDCDFLVQCHNDTQGVSRDVVDTCLNGPVMPFIDSRAKTFKNVFCHRCKNGNLSHDECLGKIKPSRTDYYPDRPLFFDLLDFFVSHDTKVSQNTGGCGEMEIYDKNTDKCRELFCPPFLSAAHGKCEAILNHMDKDHYRLYIIFMLSETVTVEQPIEPYESLVQRSVFLKYEKAFEPCDVIELDVTLFYGHSTSMFHHIEVDMVIEQNNFVNCTVDELRHLIRQHTRFAETWSLNGHSRFLMEGRVTFWSGRISQDLNVASAKLVRQKQHSLFDIDQSTIFKTMYLCPYVILNIDDYDKFAKKPVNASVRNIKDNLQLMKHQLEGFYYLSDDEVAACIDVYLGDHNSAHSMFCFILVYVVTLTTSIVALIRVNLDLI